MTLTQLIDLLAARTGLPRKAVRDVLDALGTAAPEVFRASGEIPLPHIGKLKVQDKPERQGRNPATGEAVTIPARRVVKFSAAKALKDAL
jgi:DNA-binding protein HU-beta